ncbi:MAG: aspartate carbamoyltransferase, partial [Clostridia bacterium]|nr:aspartate carbamoyltransferase [Clostridia bacterium]
TEEWEELTNLACEIRKNPSAYADVCRGRIMATLFYEPSTRTQMSFQTAMLRLGGQLIGFDDPNSSSVAKGESHKYTVRVISGYADLITMRHPMAGAAKVASMYSRVPVINAGDGGHLHPSQTLTDLVTLRNEKGRFDHLRIGLCGDLKNGRTVHSLIKTMSRVEGNTFVLISTPSLRVPMYVREQLRKSGCAFEEVDNLAEHIGDLDVLYMTRIQKERFASIEEYHEQSGVYILDAEKMALAKDDMIVMHPLPRVDEITIEVDDDPRAKYYEQTEYGLYARMALIMTMLQEPKKELATLPVGSLHACGNPNSITNRELYVPRHFRRESDMLVCDYCDEHTLLP